MITKKLDDFFNKLNESYENPSDIRWVDNESELIGLFNVGDKLYKITCINRGNDIWTYKFYNYNKLSNTFDSSLIKTEVFDKMRVISTIRNGMIYLIDKKFPKSILYAAMDDSDGRKKLYDRFSNELKDKYKYNYYTKLGSGKQLYILYKDINIEIVLDVVGDIINEI